ncbi:thioredoxin domain-containing protein [Desertivirga brevis]|uniref:thioredoxin domain-containing protein n=1 Tax=Desertivirga brevis TaxID=2810310 RepID=UPI001F620B9B|nr:thioredoxin domain-containing protein [Pedobacter sp. SYSU D00873]
MIFKKINHITMKKTKTLILLALLAVAGANAQTSSQELPLTLSEVAIKAKSDGAQIIDARTPEEFSQNHLKGAVNINAAISGYEKDLEKLSKEKSTIVYSIANGRSVSLAKELRQKGFKEVLVLPGGISNWIGAGYPIVNNTKKGVAINSDQFNTLTASSDLVLVDFGSKYCGACRKLVPVLDSLEKQQGFAARVLKIEAYDNTELLKNLKVSQLPTLVLYKNGKEVWKKPGQSTTSEIGKVVDSYQRKSGVANAGK